MKSIILNKTKNVSERYYLIAGSMGNYGNPKNHVNHLYQIGNGIDRGNGYQGYMSVSYAITLDYFPQEAKDKIIKICNELGLAYN